MSTPKARSMGNAGTTADAHEEEGTPTSGAGGPREADAESDGGGKQATGSSSRGDQPPGEDAKPSGKQTIESSRKAASLDRQPTRDDGDNDDEGELK